MKWSLVRERERERERERRKREYKVNVCERTDLSQVIGNIQVHRDTSNKSYQIKRQRYVFLYNSQMKRTKK